MDGELEARDRAAAVLALERQGYYPVSVTAASSVPPADRDRGIAGPAQTGAAQVLEQAEQCRDRVADFVTLHRSWVGRGACGAGIGLVLAVTFSEFPLGPSGLATIVVLLSPFLLRLSLGWTIPLVGGLLLPPPGAAVSS